MVKKHSLILLAILALILGACGGNKDKQESGEGLAPAVEISDEEKLADDEIVVIVNGEEVNGSTYNLVYSQLKLHAGQFEEELDIDDVKKATMDSLIDRQLVFQEARELGIDLTNDEIDEQFAEVKEENEEGLSTLLQQYQLTEEAFKEQMKFELTMNEFLREAIEVSVDDAEVEERYEKAKEGNEQIPEYDEIKSELKKQLLQEKTNEAFEERIAKVKEKADIEQKI